MKADHTLFTDFLTALKVKHTPDYSNHRFLMMPFKSLFGLSKLLDEYSVGSAGYHLSDKSELSSVPVPFIAGMAGGYVIVTAVTADEVSYLTQGEPETASLALFTSSWTGDVFVAVPGADAEEPQYGLHCREMFFNRAKKWILLACALFLAGYLVIANGIFHHPTMLVTMVIDLFGLWLSFMLVQKSLKISTSTADRVCGVIEEGGCDDVLSLPASKFFGLFGWSEVGLAYFSVSLLSLLIFPQWTGYLALCNICCLPFTAWSIWYQRFRAHRWCTMCIGVQCSLWLLFFSYLFGGWLKEMFPLRIEFFILGASYVGALLAINALTPYIHRPHPSTDDPS